MGAVRGIKVVLDTTAQWWSETADAVFLGIHGRGGGREFRLNGGPEAAIDASSSRYVLALGTSCCPDGSELQVQYSTGVGDNDPVLNPIEITEIESVYLRKETADSTAVNDDVLALGYASVLVCDESGALRRFKKTGEINFSDESGLQHWLRPASPPQIHVTVKLTGIIQKEAAKKPAGYDWEFDFSATVGGVTKYLLNDHGIEIDKKDEPDNWERGFEVYQTFAVDGCCGKKVPVSVAGKVVEFDVGKDDTGEASHTQVIESSPEGTHLEQSLTANVDGWLNNRESNITFTYEVTAKCVS